ncbi:MAG: hypothetical protein GW939_01225 [Candidatus Magasanikbacteria bacterium]|nr:hypothetical protein [Candidatus Magasanikbacteria bacterium]
MQKIPEEHTMEKKTRIIIGIAAIFVISSTMTLLVFYVVSLFWEININIEVDKVHKEGEDPPPEGRATFFFDDNKDDEIPFLGYELSFIDKYDGCRHTLRYWYIGDGDMPVAQESSIFCSLTSQKSDVGGAEKNKDEEVDCGDYEQLPLYEFDDSVEGGGGHPPKYYDF